VAATLAAFSLTQSQGELMNQLRGREKCDYDALPTARVEDDICACLVLPKPRKPIRR
jgi:hypothetical protein